MKPNWVVEIDIEKYFDKISHDFIIQNTPFIPKIILEKWLKQGYILRKYEDLGTFAIETGIPQGGIISPTLCTTTLDGAESYIREKLYTDIINGFLSVSKAGYTVFTKDSLTRKINSKIIKLFRFADDIIILTKSKLVALKSQEYLIEFLLPRGLKLSETKTKITDISGGKAYFKFIGYGFEKRFNTSNNKTKWYIIPPEENV